MKSKLTRREFLQTAGALTLIPYLNRISAHKLGTAAKDTGQPNIILIVFDALSSFNLSLYGYPRETSPNLERFANRSIVYHNHHSTANNTTPSTASLFTGTYSWTHRVVTLRHPILKEIQSNNLFNLLSDKFNITAFSQNTYADMLLYQLDQYLDHHLAQDSFSLVGNTFYDAFSGKTAKYISQSFDGFLFTRSEVNGSLFLSILNELKTLLGVQINNETFKEMYPDGIPKLANTGVYFIFSQIIDGLKEMLAGLHPPYFSYIHLMPPHAPRTPSSQFLDRFDDGWKPKPKNNHELGDKKPNKALVSTRQKYDEFVANVDFEFGRLLDFLETSGLLENNYVIFTSDHGELFERGVIGHGNRLLYEPLIRIPLLISTPGQSERIDIHDLTSTVDILPTLAHISNIPKPEWAVGDVLPGFGEAHYPDRSVWSLKVRGDHPQARDGLEKVTLALIKGDQKLISYNYRKTKYEFYDLGNDPEELDNRYKSSPIAKEMQAKIDRKFREIKQPIK